MKYCFCSTIVFLILISCPIYPQVIGNRKHEQNVPVLIRPTSHDPNFKNFPKFYFITNLSKNLTGILYSSIISNDFNRNLGL